MNNGNSKYVNQKQITWNSREQMLVLTKTECLCVKEMEKKRSLKKIQCKLSSKSTVKVSMEKYAIYMRDNEHKWIKPGQN